MGVTVHFIGGYYRHMDHERGGLSAEQQFGISANTRNLGGYTNRDSWGYINANSLKLNDDVTKLYV